VVAGYLLGPPSITFGQNVIDVDASVLAVAPGDGGTNGQPARERLADETLVAPELVDLEVESAMIDNLESPAEAKRRELGRSEARYRRERSIR